ncbi:hypothetical protein PoB_007610400 [Plakobranchus ocellatus]|uniref:Uncharacterized protein n=1 Tax=Plakobranchus ocellatus TaxID=259542 RepID=A0AAV4DZF9_9GAST|nr:hypothetical protein PoB_007610400 [Plakobranchus ocellatus]
MQVFDASSSVAWIAQGAAKNLRDIQIFFPQYLRLDWFLKNREKRESDQKWQSCMDSLVKSFQIKLQLLPNVEVIRLAEDREEWKTLVVDVCATRRKIVLFIFRL